MTQKKYYTSFNTVTASKVGAHCHGVSHWGIALCVRVCVQEHALSTVFDQADPATCIFMYNPNDQ
jgi:hypothetical protein